jgi:putative ATP-dependent endonuclease of OLD family
LDPADGGGGPRRVSLVIGCRGGIYDLGVQIRRVTVINFRGVRTATWVLPPRRFLCLVGAGDSTKTTLLDAVELVLGAHRNVTFTDADFFNCDLSQSIVIRVLVGDLDDAMLADNAFGLDLCGLTETGEVIHDPEDGAEACVLLQLTVDEDLEPEWMVLRSDDDGEGKVLTAGRRKALGLFRVDDKIDTHLRWGRDSALTRLTPAPSAGRTATAARRAARSAVFDAPTSPLHETAAQVATAAKTIGSAPYRTLRPGWDPAATAALSALVLHDESIPLTAAGLGTRRLTSIAVQETAAIGGDIVLVDEIEHGLEPHRLLHILHRMKQRVATGRGQVIVTTHSPVAVQALQAADICVVRNMEGATTVRQVPDAIDEVQGALRACPAAVLSRRVVVGEGKTEVGIARHLIRAWDTERFTMDEPTHAAIGTALVDGVGKTAPGRARIFNGLGVAALLLCDNDDRLVDNDVAAAHGDGVTVLRWQTGHSTEAEIVSTLDITQIGELLNLAAEVVGAHPVRDGVISRLNKVEKPGNLDPASWLQAGHTLNEIRMAVATAATAKQKEWFKREDRGEMLGAFITDRWEHFSGTELGKHIVALRRFVYAEES